MLLLYKHAPQFSQANKINKIKWSHLLQVKALPPCPAEPSAPLILIHIMMFLSRDQGSPVPGIGEAAPHLLCSFLDPLSHYKKDCGLLQGLEHVQRKAAEMGKGLEQQLSLFSLRRRGSLGETFITL